jgi:O-antigen ligase
MPAHNLYVEVFQELGAFGVILIVAFIIAIFVNFRHARRALKRSPDPDPYLIRLVDAMQTWLLMNTLFSFASYGLSSYEWYLFAGLSVVVRRMALATLPATEPKAVTQTAPGFGTALAPGNARYRR